MGNLIKWTGSKSYLAKQIISFFPDFSGTYYEPFLGGGSILLNLRPSNAMGSDIDKNLIHLWNKLKNEPFSLLKEYKCHYFNLKKERKYYYEIRERFNSNKDPSDFFFLLRTCHNGLVRYSRKGDFNSSLHIGRKGMSPELVRRLLLKHLPQIRRTEFIHSNYLGKNDFIFFDPPYEEIEKGSIYNGSFDHNELFQRLKNLNERGVKWALTYGASPIPKEIYSYKKDLKKSNSSFSRLKGKESIVREQLYLNYPPKYRETKILHFLKK